MKSRAQNTAPPGRPVHRKKSRPRNRVTPPCLCGRSGMAKAVLTVVQWQSPAIVATMVWR
eukprot:10630185-Alexandrium_andersonii.AAC.1